MAFFEELGKTLSKVGEVTAQKTKEVADLTKINAKILEVQNKLDRAYIEVGKRYLELHPANDEEEMESAVKAVYALEDQLKELRKELQDLKGTVKCENCGAESAAEAVYCSRCGQELKKETVIIDVEDFVDLEDLEDLESEK